MADANATPIGAKFGRWTVTGPGQTDRYGNRCLLVRCDCGVEKNRRPFELISGHTLSCGCRKPSVLAIQSRTHGHAASGRESRAYMCWKNMRDRCQNPKNKRFDHYGGRGIVVCDRWKLFANFLEDMGDPPAGLTLNRINNDAGYDPANCNWVSHKAQSLNTSRNVQVDTCKGRMPISEAARIAGVDRNTMVNRIKRGWPIEDLFLPPRQFQRKQIDTPHRPDSAYKGSSE